MNQVELGSKYFTKCDAKNGYWQIPIEEKSQELTTFLTPWGRFKFLRAPMGLSSTGDEYSRRGENATSDFGNIARVMDDVLIYDKEIEEHIENSVCNVIE